LGSKTSCSFAGVATARGAAWPAAGAAQRSLDGDRIERADHIAQSMNTCPLEVGDRGLSTAVTFSLRDVTRYVTRALTES
jgi:hypothetical protein